MATVMLVVSMSSFAVGTAGVFMTGIGSGTFRRRIGWCAERAIQFGGMCLVGSFIVS